MSINSRSSPRVRAQAGKWTIKPLFVVVYYAVFPLAKVSEIMPVTMTCDCTCLGHLGRRDTDRITSILCHAAQGGQGMYNSDCHMSLSPTVLLTNFTNVSDPLMSQQGSLTKGVGSVKLISSLR